MRTRDPIRDGAGAARPGVVLGMRRRQRTHGEPFLVAVVDADLVLQAGAELHVRRLHAGSLDTPEFGLVVVPPSCSLDRRERDQAAADRLDGSALRSDSRDADEVMP